MKTTIIVLLFIAAFLPFAANSQETAPQSLEIEYVPLPDVPLPTITTTLPNYVKYIYIFAIIASGFIALIVLIIAGAQYLVSTGTPEKLKEAKDRISAALLGLLILFCSWLILRTINPQLTILREPEEVPEVLPDLKPGVYLCKARVDIPGFWQQRKQAELQEGQQQKETVQQLNGILKTIGENCAPTDPIPTKGDIDKAMEDKAQFVYLVPAYQEKQYGVVLYEEKGFGGKSSIFYGDGQQGVMALENPTEWPIRNLQASSARPFIINYNPNPSWYAQFYESVHFNRNEPKKNKTSCKPGGESRATNTCELPKNKDGKNEIGSVKIEGDMFVIFLKESANWTSSSENYLSLNPGNSNLNNTIMGIWNPEECVEKREPDWRDRYYPCAERAVLVSADFY